MNCCSINISRFYKKYKIFQIKVQNVHIIVNNSIFHSMNCIQNLPCGDINVTRELKGLNIRTLHTANSGFLSLGIHDT